MNQGRGIGEIEVGTGALPGDVVHYCALEDTRIAYRCNVSAPSTDDEASGRAVSPVLMLHSLFFDRTMFDVIRSLWPASIAVFVPDHRGQGNSQAGRLAPSMAQLARDMIAFIEMRVGEPVNVVGSSMGGYVALEIARMRPDLIRSYVLSCCTTQAEKQTARFAALEARIRTEGTVALAAVLCETMFGARFVEGGGDTLEKWRRAFMLRGSGIANAVHGVFGRDSLTSILPTITQPVLVCSGEMDRAKRPEDMQFIADRIPGTRHVVFEDAGHTPPVESPIRFAKEVLSFVIEHGVKA